MCPLEFVAIPTDSPRNSPGGTFSRFGTDVYAISGTFCAVAFCCARAGCRHITRATATRQAKRHFMGEPPQESDQISSGPTGEQNRGEYTKPGAYCASATEVGMARRRTRLTCA